MAHDNEHGQNILHLIIIVNDVPTPKDYPANEKVEEVIKSLLPPGQKQNWNQYQLNDRTKALNSSESLEKNGVKDKDTLSLTKKEGGGGRN